MWSIYALGAMLSFAAMHLLVKYLTNEGLEVAAILFPVFGFGFLLYFAHVQITGMTLDFRAKQLLLLGGMAVLSYIGNLLSWRALSAAPNPGYSVAVVSMQALVVTLLATQLFGSDLSPTKIVGVVLGVVGIALVTL